MVMLILILISSMYVYKYISVVTGLIVSFFLLFAFLFVKNNEQKRKEKHFFLPFRFDSIVSE